MKPPQIMISGNGDVSMSFDLKDEEDYKNIEES